MTPQQHLERAEYLLGLINDLESWEDTAQITAIALEAQAHALIAVAVELGVPSPTPHPAVSGA